MAQGNEYRLEYAPAVYDDLNEIFAYIASDLQAPDSAMSQIARIEDAVLKLRELPSRIPLSREATLARKGYRMMVIDNFAVFFLVNEGQRVVSIRRVLHGKRNFRWWV